MEQFKVVNQTGGVITTDVMLHPDEVVAMELEGGGIKKVFFVL
jgi:hypothetical protein